MQDEVQDARQDQAQTETTETNSSAAETALGMGDPDSEADGNGFDAAELIGAPEGDYEVRAPEGREFDKETFEAVKDDLKGMNLSNKGAQQMVDMFSHKVLPIIEKKIADQAAEAQQAAAAELRKTWLTEARADREIGGARWNESIAIAGRVFDAVGFEKAAPFRQLLEDSGLGNHPDAIRFIRRVGEMIGEDKFVRGEGDSSADNRAIWDKVYGGPTETAIT